MEETLIWVEYFVEVSGFTRAKFSTGLMWFIGLPRRSIEA